MPTVRTAETQEDLFHEVRIQSKMAKRKCIGEVVEIVIDRNEGSLLGDLDRIIGKVSGKIQDREGIVYTVVESLLEEEPQYGSHTESQQGAVYFPIVPMALGDTLDRAFEVQDDHLPVGIARVLDTSILISDTFDFSQAEYSAIGYLRFLKSRGSA